MTVNETREVAVQRAHVRATIQLLGGSADGSYVYECGHTAASVVPRAPEATANWVTYTNETESANAAFPDELARIYSGAGVLAWQVWVPDSDRAMRTMLTRYGYSSTKRLPAMICDLRRANLTQVELGDLDYDSDGDVSTLGEVNAAAYPRPALRAVLREHPPFIAMRVYRARHCGRVASVLCAIDNVQEDGALDCALTYVATAPDAQRKGLATRLIVAALTDAQSRGARTSSLQASKEGFGVYARIGFETKFHFHTYEQQVRAPVIDGT